MLQGCDFVQIILTEDHEREEIFTRPNKYIAAMLETIFESFSRLSHRFILKKGSALR